LKGKNFSFQNHLCTGRNLEIYSLCRHHFHRYACQRAHEIKLLLVDGADIECAQRPSGMGAQNDSDLERLLQFFCIGIELPEMLGQCQMDGCVILVDRHETVEAAIQASAYGVPRQSDCGGQIGPSIVLMMDDLWDGTQVYLLALQNHFFDRSCLDLLRGDESLDSLKIPRHSATRFAADGRRQAPTRRVHIGYDWKFCALDVFKDQDGKPPLLLKLGHQSCDLEAR